MSLKIWKFLIMSKKRKKTNKKKKICNKKNININTLASKVNITNNFNEKKYVQ